jgi:hypothetical protein
MIDRSLPDGTEAKTTITVGFQPTGSAQVISGAGNAIVVGRPVYRALIPGAEPFQSSRPTARVRVEP